MELPDYETILFYNYYKRPNRFFNNLKIALKYCNDKYGISQDIFIADCYQEIELKLKEIKDNVDKHIDMCDKTIRHLKFNEREKGENINSIKYWEKSKTDIKKESYKHFFNIYNDSYTAILKSYSISIKDISIIKETLDQSSLYNDFLKVKDEGWFQVGIKLANGEIFKLLDSGLSSTQIAKTIFPDNHSKYRPYISSTIENSTKDKNIFKSDKKVGLILKYCILNNIKIHPMFESKSKNFI